MFGWVGEHFHKASPKAEDSIPRQTVDQSQDLGQSAARYGEQLYRGDIKDASSDPGKPIEFPGFSESLKEARADQESADKQAAQLAREKIYGVQEKSAAVPVVPIDSGAEKFIQGMNEFAGANQGGGEEHIQFTPDASMKPMESGRGTADEMDRREDETVSSPV